MTGGPFLLCHPLPFGKQHLIAHARHLPSRCTSRVASGTTLNPINNSLDSACVVLGISYSVVVFVPCLRTTSCTLRPVHGFPSDPPKYAGLGWRSVCRRPPGRPGRPFAAVRRSDGCSNIGSGAGRARCGDALIRVFLRFFRSFVSFFLVFLSLPWYTILR